MIKSHIFGAIRPQRANRMAHASAKNREFGLGSAVMEEEFASTIESSFGASDIGTLEIDDLIDIRDLLLDETD